MELITSSDLLSFYASRADDIIDMFKHEPQLIDVSSKGRDVVIIGDLHGDAVTLNLILSRYNVDEYTLVFLGDYVDRGDGQLDVLTKLLTLKMEHPDKVIMLRGNHESPLTNYTYGFVDELARRFEDESIAWFMYNEVFVKMFSNMPYACVIDGSLFLAHGGLAHELRRPEDVNRIPKGDEIPRNRLALEILWNDPSDQVEYFEMNYIRGSDPSSGMHIYFWGYRKTEEFIRESGVKAVIRGHEYCAEGYKLNHGGKVVTVFSSRASPYCEAKPKVIVYRGERVKLVDLYSGGEAQI